MSQQAQPGGALKNLRKVAGLTLDTVARLADTAPAYLSKVESGRLTPTPTYMARVATAIAAEMTRRANLPAMEAAA